MDIDALNAALSLRHSGRTEEALEAFRALFEETEDFDEKAGIVLHEASCLTTLQRYEEAKEALNRARRMSRLAWTGAYADQQEALVCMWEGRYEDSLQIYDRLLSQHPKVATDPELRDLYESVQAERGIILATLNRTEDALPLLAGALVYRVSDSKKGLILYHLGQCFLSLNQTKDAKTAFEEVGRVCQDHYCVLGSRYNLGIIYAQEGALGKALQELEWCEANLGGDDALRDYIYVWLAKVLTTAGRTAEAARYRKLIKSPEIE
jgi:tetratricopeptide (TPR) repeat protein